MVSVKRAENEKRKRENNDKRRKKKKETSSFQSIFWKQLELLLTLDRFPPPSFCFWRVF